MIEACRQGGQWALAVSLLREMSTTPIRVWPGATATMMSPTVEAYTAALTACGDAGQWEVAVSLLREVTDAYAVAAGGVNGGAGVGTDVSSADAVAVDGGGGGGDFGAEGDGSRGQPEEATTAAVTPSSAPVPLKPDHFLYNAAIEACGNAGQWQRALGLLSEISEVGLSPSVVSPRF